MSPISARSEAQSEAAGDDRNGGENSSGRALAIGLGVVLAITLWRVALLAFDQTQLYVDEAQYWFWGQNLDFGYYSKPPLIAWVIRLVTGLAGSDSPFWVRFPAPLFHAGTALLLMAGARRLFDLRTAAWVGPVYLLLPMVTLGSALFSTDTLMLFFYGLGLLALLELQRGASGRWAGLLGLAVGLGLLSKYAMMYFVLGAGLAALFVPGARIAWRDAGLAAAISLLVIAPNLWWNAQTGGTTFQHTLNNASWGGGGPFLHPRALGRYFADQFVVFGPVMFGVFLGLIARALRRRPPPREALLLWLSAPVLAILLGQALLSHANANWGVAAYIGATLLVTRYLLMGHARWLFASQALHLALALALPLVLSVAPDLRRADGRQYLGRYLGRSQVSQTFAEVAKGAGLRVIVTGLRDLSSDLNYTLRGSDLALYALPRAGFPASYYQQEFPVPANLKTPVLFASLDAAPACAEAVLKRWAPRDGAFAGHVLFASKVSPACLAKLRKGGG